MTTEVINIQIREDGSRVVSRNIDGIGGAANRAADPVDRLKGLLATLVTGAAVAQLAKLADEYTNLQNRLRLVTTGTENLSRVTKELLTLSNQTRSDFTATGELYARLASTTKELGLSQQQMLSFTRSLNQAIVLSGATAQEAAGGLRQLSQGLASGTLRGDELNSVLENFPKVAQIIAEGMGHSIGQIRKLGAEGKISAQAIIDAFASASEQLDKDFATTVPTLSQSFTVLRNNFTVFIGQLNESTGVTAFFSSLIIDLANNLDTIVAVLAGVGTAIAVTFAPAVITAFMTQIRALFALISAHPFGALATVIAGVLTTLYLLRDEIKLGIDDTTTLGDLMRAAWESVGPMIQTVADLAATFFSWLGDASNGTFNELVNDLVGYEHESDAMWLKLARIVVQVFDMIGGTVRGVMAGVQAVVMKVIAALMNNFQQLGNAIQGAMNLDGEAILNAVQSNISGWKEAGTDLGGTFGEAFAKEQMAQADSGLESMLDGYIKRAQEIGRERAALAKMEGGLNPGGTNTVTPPVDEAAAKKAARELEKLKNELKGVLDSISPVEAAKRQLAEAQDILTRSVKAGLISQTDATKAYNELAFQLRDAIDPLAALNRELDQHIDLLGMSREQAEIEQRVLESTQQLRREGIQLTQEEIGQLRAKLVVEQELSRIAQIRDQLENESQARRNRDLSEKVNTASSMVGQDGYTRGDAVNSLAGDIPGLEQTRGFMVAQQEQFAAYYAAIDEMRQADLLSETDAINAKISLFQQQYATQFQAASTALGQLASLQRSENKKQAQIGKQAAIAQTIIQTYQSATSAFSAMASIPYVGPFLGAAAAAAAVAAGMANVQAIRSQNVGFRTGGEWTVGGSGGPDSQNVNFRATPGEKISVHTPSQARALERLGENEEGPRRGGLTMVVNQNFEAKPDRGTLRQQHRAMRRVAVQEMD